MDLANFWGALTFSYSYNAAVVSLALIAQGMVTGILGSLLLYRRRALITDVMGHATLPGVALGFLLSYVLLGDEKAEWAILLGALIMIFLSICFIKWIQTWTSQDAAFALTLSSFYALGVMLLSYIQTIPSGAKAGLEHFILGQSATINLMETQLILGGTCLVLVVYLLFHKELKLVCFDSTLARASGYNVRRFDWLVTILTAIIVAIGIRAMGFILIIGLVTIPPLTASLIFRSWNRFIVGAAALGAFSCYVGAALSAGIEELPTGAGVVLVCMACYLTTLLWYWRRENPSYNNLDPRPQPVNNDGAAASRAAASSLASNRAEPQRRV